MNIRVYETADRKRPFDDWLRGLGEGGSRDRIRARVKLLEFGHFGDWKLIGDGIIELRLHFGSGFRVYLGLINPGTVLLLCGGDKGSQGRDIKRAQRYWTDFRRVNR